MTLHFVYAGSPDDGRIQSPYCITRNLYRFLKQRTEVAYHRWDAKNDIDIKPDDVVLGHPHYEQDTTIQRIFRQNVKCKAKCLIFPFHHRRVCDNWPFDSLVKKADKVFSICGPYWYDTIGKTQFAHWKDKITRLDMAVNTDVYPFLRERTGPRSFNPVGKRRFVYIGSSMPQKNLDYLVKIMSKFSNVGLNWYGGSGDHPLAKLPNVKTVGWVVLNSELAKKIVAECDIFVNTSFSDANPTTLLESTAWGIIPACTKESGYYDNPMFTNISLDDFGQTCIKLDNLLRMDSTVLYNRAVRSRERIENEYTWDIFCKKVWDGIRPLL